MSANHDGCNYYSDHLPRPTANEIERAKLQDQIDYHRGVKEALAAKMARSLDAAVDKIEKALPGWAWTIFNRDETLLGQHDMDRYGAILADSEIKGGPEPWTEKRSVFEAHGETATAALLAALKKARGGP
jgi:hypothetical protein